VESRDLGFLFQVEEALCGWRGRLIDGAKVPIAGAAYEHESENEWGSLHPLLFAAMQECQPEKAQTGKNTSEWKLLSRQSSRKSICIHLGSPRLWPRHAPIFAALGDETGLALLARLSTGAPRSISQLAKGSSMARQGITAHLRALEKAGLVRSEMIDGDCVLSLDRSRSQRGGIFLISSRNNWRMRSAN
jgi:DNA-binding transcriptional ArsR family regulator